MKGIYRKAADIYAATGLFGLLKRLKISIATRYGYKEYVVREYFIKLINTHVLKPKFDLQGWFSEYNRIMLEKVVRTVAIPDMKILEVGTWKGLSTSVIAKVVAENNGTIYCVDTWGGNQGLGGIHSEPRYKDIFAIFRNNMKKLGVWHYIRPLYMDSFSAAEVLKDKYFDLIFIDGDHTFSVVKADILNFLPKLKAGGIICGDDCEWYFEQLDSDFVYQHKDKDIGIHESGKSGHCGVILALHEIFGKDFTLENNSNKPNDPSYPANFWWKKIA
jgi:hypothetical protein